VRDHFTHGAEVREAQGLGLDLSQPRRDSNGDTHAGSPNLTPTRVGVTSILGGHVLYGGSTTNEHRSLEAGTNEVPT
jgi:hypothetical protein